MSHQRLFAARLGASGPAGRYESTATEAVVFGPGCASRLGEELERLGRSRALLVTGNTIATKSSLVDRISDVLGDALAGVFSGAEQHVPRESVVAAADAAREVGADMIVSLGGGSPTDTAKLTALCVAADVRSTGALADYQIGYHSGADAARTSARVVPLDALPIIALATTLSAGEFNGWAGSLDRSRLTKDTYGAPQLTPRVVMLDPALTLDTPSWLWGSTGMRALDHAIETVYSTEHQPFADALCLHATGTLVRSLDESRLDPSDIAARGRCQVAAWMSISSLASVQTGLSHAIGLQLGARCDVPHGVTSSILLPEVMTFNLPQSADRQAMIAEAMGVCEPGMDDETAGMAAAQRLRQLVRDYGVQDRLSAWGVSEEDIDPIASATAVTPANPRQPDGPEQIATLLRGLL
jgi:alcohol dehydrogenase class IV